MHDVICRSGIPVDILPQYGEHVDYYGSVCRVHFQTKSFQAPKLDSPFDVQEASLYMGMPPCAMLCSF
jgi:hypothetical protein